MLASNVKNYNPWLDLFRGLAALIVCISHIRSAFWVDYGAIQVKAWWHIPVYLITGFGHQSVIIFFVLSGFLVGGGVLAKGKIFSWSDYFPARLIRLWLVLIPALIFTAICDFLTLNTLPNAFDGVLSSLWNSGPSSPEGFGWRVFLANSLFLQTIEVPVFGSNGPLWSLANEFWYYILFPLITCGLSFTGTFGLFKRGVLLLLALCIVFWLSLEITSYFSIWLMGVACFLVIRKYPLKINIFFTLASVIFFFCFLFATKYFHGSERLVIVSDILVGLCFSMLLICLNGYQAPWRSYALLNIIIKKVSEFSYSLYLFHFPLVILLAASIIGTDQLQPNLVSVAILLGATGLCLFVAWISWLIFERHNDCIRRAAYRLIAHFAIFSSRISGNRGAD